LLWFGFTIARHLRTPAKTLCSSALAAHTGREMPPMESFSDLQTAVMANAEHIRVLNKRGLYIPDASDDIRYTSLEANPPYVFTRHLNRLVRSLEQGANDLSPLTMTSVEPIADLKLALAIS